MVTTIGWKGNLGLAYTEYALCIEACREASGTGNLRARYSGTGAATENVGRRAVSGGG